MPPLLLCTALIFTLAFGSTLAQLGSSLNSPCTEDQRKANIEEHQKCFQTVQARFQTGSGGQFCDHLHEQVNKCSEIFKDCETTEDIR